jgi:hypothetical protein
MNRKGAKSAMNAKARMKRIRNECMQHQYGVPFFLDFPSLSSFFFALFARIAPLRFIRFAKRGCP